MQDTLEQVHEASPEQGWDIYDGGGGSGYRRVPAGRYLFRLPTILTTDTEAWRPTAAGHLQLTFTATVVGGEYDGEEFRYTRFSTRPFSNGKGNFLGKLIRSLGYDGAVPRTDEDYQAIIQSLAGKTFESDTDWQYRCWQSKRQLGCKQTLYRSAKDAPTDANGEPLGSVGCPTCFDPDTGEALTVWAQPQLTFPVSPFRAAGRR